MTEDSLLGDERRWALMRLIEDLYRPWRKYGKNVNRALITATDSEENLTAIRAVVQALDEVEAVVRQWVRDNPEKETGHGTD